MSNLALFGMVVAVGISAIVQIFTDPRINREFVYKSLIGIAVFAAHCTIGGLIMIFVLTPRTPEGAVGVIIAWLGWLGLGTLGLIRFAPRLRQPPGILMRFGIPDLLCLLMIAAGLAMATGNGPKFGLA